MTLTVGTDVFAAIADADAYWVKRGNDDWVDADLEDKEIWSVKATDFLVRGFRYRGTKETSTQGLPWPRVGAEDDDGYALEGTPDQLKAAQFIVADLLRQDEAGTISIDLEGIVTGDAAVKMVKVGPITKEFDTAAITRGSTILSHVIETLRPLTLSDTLQRS